MLDYDPKSPGGVSLMARSFDMRFVIPVTHRSGDPTDLDHNPEHVRVVCALDRMATALRFMEVRSFVRGCTAPCGNAGRI